MKKDNQHGKDLAIPPKPGLRVLIVDDHAVVRRGLAEILAEEFHGIVVEESANGAAALEMARIHDLDLVLLDISMPGRSGLDLMQDLKAKRPHLPVLILSIHSEDLFALRALRSGASGYITKDSAQDELVAAVRKVLAGGRYVSPAMGEKLAATLSAPSGRPRHESLSNREFEVLCLIASGMAVKEIADKLSLSVKTISTYRMRILEKMVLKTNADLTRYVIHEGLND